MKEFNSYMTNGHMSRQQEAKFKNDSEKHFKSHRELPWGRDFRFNKTADPVADQKFRSNFDRVFKNSPGVGI